MKTIIPWVLVVILAIAMAASFSSSSKKFQVLEGELTEQEQKCEKLALALEGAKNNLAKKDKQIKQYRAQIESLAETLEAAITIKRKVSLTKAPSGYFLNGFDKGLNNWSVPAWATGNIQLAKGAGKFRRGEGSLSVGYVYGEKPMAVMGPITMHGFGGLKAIRLYARSNRDVQLAIGVVEENGARYEIKTPAMRPKDGWRLCTVHTAVLGLVKGSVDDNNTLDVDRIKAIYVVDCSPHTDGGNVLFIDDIAVDLFKKNNE